ncbi:MAG TPA: hypothetical protein VKN99_15730 [Polyangia bacterium]|nr:hypothetical protein [Polyangia bacterium]
MRRFTSLAWACWGAFLLAPACGDDARPPEPWKPDVLCPGAGCPDTGETRLQVGFAKASLSPSAANYSTDPYADFADWHDDNCNDVWNPGETAAGRPNGVWLFGRDSGRPGLGVHDDPDGHDDGLEARTIVIKTHGLAIALTQLDLGGYFIDEMDKIRDLVRQAGDRVDLVLVGSTHNHEAPDTVGLWGRDDQHSGIDLKYIDFINHAAAQSIHDALAGLQEATLTIGQARTEDAGGDMSHYVGDSRDPVVIDNMLTLFLWKKLDGTPITALVNWSSHPDDTNGNNHMLTAGYPHYLRAALERGFTRMGTTYPALAPAVLFMEGQVGGQIGPSGLVHAIDDSGAEVHKCNLPQYAPQRGCPDPRNPGQFIHITPDDCSLWPRAIGHAVATFAYKAAQTGATTVADVPVGWRTKRFKAHVDNVGFQVLYLAGNFMGTRNIVDYDPTKPIDMTNRPATITEETYVTLGPSSFVTIPGELHPELFLGGYHGEHAGTYPLIKPQNPNPPDLSKAPPPPYVCDVMEGDYRFALGLTSDYLGYILPAFNFELGTPQPWIDEAPGDHYEETRSISGDAETELIGTMKKLISYGRSNVPTTVNCPGR